MKLERYDDMDDVTDEDLELIRRKVEYRALNVAYDMLGDSETSSTARASIIRGAFADSAARRKDDERETSPFDSMSRDDLLRLIAVEERKLALLESRAEVEDAEIVDADSDRSVFD